MCDLVYVLPPHDLAGSLSRGFKTHTFEQIPEAGDRENSDDLVQSVHVGNIRLERHRLAPNSSHACPRVVHSQMTPGWAAHSPR
jgi:hypothetical protein